MLLLTNAFSLYVKGCQRPQMELFHPYLRVTRRLAAEIHQLCKLMSFSDAAQNYQLDWKTIKEIDKQYLEAHYSHSDLNEIHILTVDEISISKGHSYLTVVIYYETGHVVYVGKERKAQTLISFFTRLTAKRRLWPFHQTDSKQEVL